ncbi:hypothetical protein GNF80_00035 [Clostridium perfringens]|nr:hypothetical protein [Clostridium perfringens]
MSSKEKLRQLEKLLCKFVNHSNIESTEQSIEALRFAVNELNTRIHDDIKCVEIRNYVKQPVLMVHSSIAAQLENFHLISYGEINGNGLTLGNVSGRELNINDALTCDFLVKKIVDGKEVISRVEGYVILVLD